MLRCVSVALAFALGTSTAFAQVEMQTNQLDQHAGIVRQRILLNSTLNHRRGSASYNRATPGQEAACANKGRYRAQFGAGNPKIRRLYSLCRSVGL